MHFVYILDSGASPGHSYVGLTTNLDRRVRDHITGKSVHTNKYRPGTLSTYIAFSDRTKAFQVERYLKSGSARAFAKGL